MRKTRLNGSFIVCLVFNMGLNFQWSIPAWVLLALHFWLGLPIWLFWGALGVWIVSIILWMLIIGWAGRCSNIPDPQRENKNPYSAKAYKKPIQSNSDNNT